MDVRIPVSHENAPVAPQLRRLLEQIHSITQQYGESLVSSDPDVMQSLDQCAKVLERRFSDDPDARIMDVEPTATP